MTITIPDKALIDAEISPNELLIDFATYLYDKQVLSIGQARKIVVMDLIAFQMELSKRNIYIHYDVVDLAKDLANLRQEASKVWKEKNYTDEMLEQID